MASEREDLAVVVTGCDSGFGKALALELLSRGYTVFACCLQARYLVITPSILSRLQRLRLLPNLRARAKVRVRVSEGP